MHAPRKKTWHEKFVRSGYFLGAVLLHLILFFLIATYVIFKPPPPPPTDDFHAVAVKVAPPPPQPPSSGAAANNPQFEPQAVVVPVVTPQSVISTHTASFTIDASKMLNQALSHVSDQAAQGTGLSQGGGGLGSGTGNAFGSSTGSSAQLTGYFYDLKQTSDQKPTGMTPPWWRGIMAKYVAQGWDESILEPYYKSKAPLYTNAFAISTRPSEEAPKAFGLEKEVQPAMWVVHYHVKVEAPQAGEYRMAGFGDDILVVKIKGETVLDGGWISLARADVLHETLPNAWSQSYSNNKSGWKDHISGMGPVNGLLKIGPTFHVDTAEPVDMDVLVGDQGGACAFYLLIEKEGNTYEKLPDGTPKLPFFQIDTKPAPTFSDKEEHPPYSTTPEPWQAAPD